jgi:serine/threonine protein kinase
MGFLVMTRIKGKSLDQCGRLPLSAALQISREILDALDFAHQQGVIHREVKPSNILIDARGHAYIMDFGIALVAGTERLTRTGTAVGTPEYMSPEQITNPADLDHRTDVYSFGCVLYEMLTGQPPFGSRDQGITEFQIMEAHVTKQPAPILLSNPSVDKNTESVVLRALAKNRDERFGGCAEMARSVSIPGWAPPPVVQPPNKISQLLFSFKGRIGRARYWKGVLMLLPFNILVLLSELALMDSSWRVDRTGRYWRENDLAVLVLFISMVGLWPPLALAIKRWHDRDRTAWWFLTSLIPFVQVLFILWITIETWFLRGTTGPNRFGVDPLEVSP